MGMRQNILPGCEEFRPTCPTIRNVSVAHAIAVRLVEQLNPENIYWEPCDVPDRILDIERVIRRSGNVRRVMRDLHRRERANPPRNCQYGWEGQDEYCQQIADKITSEELDKAVLAWKRRFVWGE